MAYIAVDGCTLMMQSGMASSIRITSMPSMKVKAGGKGVYSGTLQVMVSGYTGGKITNGDGTGSGVINPGSKKVKVNGQYVALEGDISMPITITGTRPNPPSGTITEQVTDTVKITLAGQMKVKAN